jgi:CheY-like chemotaxis protein
MTTTGIKKILLADDDRDDQDIFQEALSLLNPEIVCEGAGNGLQALALLTSQKTVPNIIFVDINMPIMNGWELLGKLKSDKRFGQIPVIIYSTSSRPEDKSIAEDLGAICFVTKPGDYRLVKGMLKIVIDHLEEDSISNVCEEIKRILGG